MAQHHPLFRNTVVVRPWVIVLCLVTHAFLKWVFFSTYFQVEVAAVLFTTTKGLLTPVLVAGLIEWLILVVVVMGLIGQLRAKDIGLDHKQAMPALAIVGVLWIAVQAAAAATGTMANGQLNLATEPLGQMPLEGIGVKLQAVLGSGLIEEVLYRGFLLTQVYLILVRHLKTRQKALSAAIVLSAIYFGINHIPAGLRMGLGPTEVAVYVGHVTLVGMLFATLFLRTANLLIAGGAHALLNEPFALFSTPVDPALFALIGVSIVLLGWPTISRYTGSMFQIGELEGKPAF